MVVRVKRCPNCLRSNVPREDAVCSMCGHVFQFRAAPPPLEPPPLPPTARWVDPAPHDVSTAALASLFVVGAGQFYNRQSAKGSVLFAVAAVLFGATLWLWSIDLFALFILLWLACIADAALIAGRLLDQQQVKPWQCF